MNTLISLFDPSNPSDAGAFAWAVDSDGYKIQGDMVVRAGGPMRPYNPATAPSMHRVLAEISYQKERAAEAVLTFVRAYGLLGIARAGADVEAEALSAILEAGLHLGMILDLLVDGRHGPPSAQDVRHFDKSMDVRSRLRLEPTDEGVTVRLTPASLVDYCGMLAAHELINGQLWQPCAYCGTPFRIGEGGARRGKTTCSSSHRSLLSRRKAAHPAAQAR